MDPIEAVESKINYGTPITKTDQQAQQNRMHYMHQEVDFQKTPLLFFPPGKEMLFLGIYFITIPYIIGLLFLFFYISSAQLNIFKAIGMDASLLLVWMVGYELLAALILFYFITRSIVVAFSGSKNEIG